MNDKENIILKRDYDLLREYIPYIAHKTAYSMLYFEYIWQQKNKGGAKDE